MRITTTLAYLLLFGITLCSGSATLAAAANPSEINFGFIPGENPEKMKTAAIELAKALQKKLGIPVNVYIPKTYQGLIEAMKNKKVDFAFYTAMSFVFAEKEAGAKVLLKKVWETPFYYSVILARADSGIRKVEDLKGMTFAFVDEKSTSGYLYPKVMLKKKNLDSKTFFAKTIFAGNHQAAIDLLVKKEVDAVAVFADDTKGKKTAWQKFTKAVPAPRVLWVSDPIPNDPFCVRQEFFDQYPRLTLEMMSALIDFKDESDENNILKKLFGVKEMQPATTRQYQPVRELVRELDLKIE